MDKAELLTHHLHRTATLHLSNESSNLLLEELWKEHSELIDDQKRADNFSAPISVLVPNKHMVREAKNWESNSRSIVKIVEILKNSEATMCLNNPSCNSRGKQVKDINIFLNNRHTTDPELLKSDDKSYITNKTNSNVNLSTKRQLISQFPPSKFNDSARMSSISKEMQASKIFSVQTKQTDLNKDNNSTHKDNIVNSNEEWNSSAPIKSAFKTAREQLIASNPAAKRSLGTARKAQGSRFISPMMTGSKEEEEMPEITDERLKHIDPKMIELIQSEIIDNGAAIEWDEIAGLKLAKSVIQEAVVWPLLRPDIFTGLRRPPKGVLLFGPPGTGKTLIGKCVASQCHATFFNISASSLTSKWIGDGEKMVRALFAVARCHQPAVIFIDEIDSLLTQRSDTEHEATRRIKTEFLVQFDGAGTGEEDRILIIGATNRPQELDEAARRRLVKRLYIPLPDYDARKQIVMNLMRSERNELQEPDIEQVCSLTEGYSGADMRSLCSEAAMGPIRSVPLSQIINIETNKVRPVTVEDFRNALERVRPSVSPDDLTHYIKWNKTYGSGC